MNEDWKFRIILATAMVVIVTLGTFGLYALGRMLTRSFEP